MSEWDRDRARWAAVAAAAVVLTVIVLTATWLARDRAFVASVPQPSPLDRVAAVSVDPHQTACIGGITVLPNAEIAELRIGSMGRPPAPLTVVASGAGGYRSVTRVPATWVDNGVVDVRIRPPRSAVDGRLCVRNDGHHGIALYAADDRSMTVATTTVDGKPKPANIQLTFLEAGRSTIAGHLTRIAAACGAFKPIGGTFPMLLLACGVVVGIPLVLAWAMVRALRDDAS